MSKSELERVRADYVGACETVAKMHAAVFGEVRGPDVGVVEDVAALRAHADRMFDAISRYGSSILGGYAEHSEGKEMRAVMAAHLEHYPTRVPADSPHRAYEMRKGLEALLNAHNAEATSNTPDFILANFLRASLVALDGAIREREGFYGRELGGEHLRGLR